LAIARIGRISPLAIACQSGQARLDTAVHVECDATPACGSRLHDRLLEQTESTGTLGRPTPAVNLKLGVDVPDVNFNRIHRQVELIADFA
jgi:positive regulator of sigma E activity